MIVADGMGGRPEGEYASSLAAEVIQAHLSSPESLVDELGDRMAEAVSLANLEVWNASIDDRHAKAWGTDRYRARAESGFRTLDYRPRR